MGSRRRAASGTMGGKDSAQVRTTELGAGRRARERNVGPPRHGSGNGRKNPSLIHRPGIPKVAITGEQLSLAVRTLLDITAWNMKLPHDHTAVVTRCHSGPAPEAFVTIFGSSEQLPAHRVVRYRL